MEESGEHKTYPPENGGDAGDKGDDEESTERKEAVVEEEN